MRIVQTSYGLRIYLDEIDRKVFNATWPVASSFLQMMLMATRGVLLAFISQGEEKIMSYLDRIQDGEPAEKVTTEMVHELNISMPSGVESSLSIEEIRKALGWEK